MNVPFTLKEPELDASFLAQARAAGLVNLEGHRSVGRHARQPLQRHAARRACRRWWISCRSSSAVTAERT